jgi:hypothetical protein
VSKGDSTAYNAFCEYDYVEDPLVLHPIYLFKFNDVYAAKQDKKYLNEHLLGIDGSI